MRPCFAPTLTFSCLLSAAGPGVRSGAGRANSGDMSGLLAEAATQVVSQEAEMLGGLEDVGLLPLAPASEEAGGWLDFGLADQIVEAGLRRPHKPGRFACGSRESHVLSFRGQPTTTVACRRKEREQRAHWQ